MSLYLDNNATTPVAPEVVDAMLPFLRGEFGNPSSLHPPGERAADALAHARSAVARLIGARSPQDVTFTSGGTESIYAALSGSLALHPARRRIVTSRVEHAAVLAPIERLEEREGYEVVRLEVDGEGRLDLDSARSAIDGGTAFVSLQSVNNETGVVTDPATLAAVGEVAREHGAPFHLDAMQAVGKIPVSVADFPLDLLSASAHKFHGPKGCGALWIRPGLELEPLFVGGPQERDRRAGTENVPAIVGTGRAAELAREHVENEPARRSLGALRDRLERELLERLPDARATGTGALRVPSTSNLTFAGISGEALVMMLGERGLAASSGSACSSGKQGASHVLLAMGIPEDRALGALRLSLSRDTPPDEIGQAIDLVAETVALLRELAVP